MFTGLGADGQDRPGSIRTSTLLRRDDCSRSNYFLGDVRAGTGVHLEQHTVGDWCAANTRAVVVERRHVPLPSMGRRYHTFGLLSLSFKE